MRAGLRACVCLRVHWSVRSGARQSSGSLWIWCVHKRRRASERVKDAVSWHKCLYIALDAQTLPVCESESWSRFILEESSED